MQRVMASVLNAGTDPFHLMDCIYVQKPGELQLNHVLLLHGGADISPSIYNQQPNDFCFAERTPSARDLLEMAFIAQALKMNLPIIGICRGAQLLCAMDGGSLVQHIVGHAANGNHTIQDTRTKEYYRANSAHHQMMKPKTNNGNLVLAICPEKVMGYEEGEVPQQFSCCPEIVYFPNMRGLGIQGHPEWMPGSNFTKYCASLINNFLLKD